MENDYETSWYEQNDEEIIGIGKIIAITRVWWKIRIFIVYNSCLTLVS